MRRAFGFSLSLIALCLLLPATRSEQAPTNHSPPSAEQFATTVVTHWQARLSR